MNISLHWRKMGWVAQVITLWMLIPLAACRPTPVPILSNPSCEPPCWKNIRPGETTKEETVSRLQELREVDPTTITLNGKSWNIFEDAIYFNFKESKLEGRVYINNGKVSVIEIFCEGGNKELDVTFDEAVNELGEPEYIINVSISGGLPLAPSTSYIVTAIQPDRGFLFDYDTRYLPKAQKAELRPENKLRVIGLFDPAFFNHLLEAGFFSLGRLDASETRKYWIPWDGYGNIAEKYPPVIIK